MNEEQELYEDVEIDEEEAELANFYAGLVYYELVRKETHIKHINTEHRKLLDNDGFFPYDYNDFMIHTCIEEEELEKTIQRLIKNDYIDRRVTHTEGTQYKIYMLHCPENLVY